MEEFLLASFLSAMATGLGALPILFFKKASHRWRDILLAFTAGVMVTAATFELIPEALQIGGLGNVVLGISLGVITLTILERTIPHLDLDHGTKNMNYDRKAVLVITAIILHNLPEGLSVGVSYGSGVEGLGPFIAFAIGLQNAPEGFLVALYLIQQQVRRLKAFMIASFTGAVEVITAIIG